MGLSHKITRLYGAKGWAAIMVLLMGLMSYMCGRVSMSWRKAFERAKAKRPAAAGV